MALERERRLLEAQVKDSATRLDEAEQNALKVRCFFRFVSGAGGGQIIFLYILKGLSHEI